MGDFALRRRRLVDELRQDGIGDERVLAAIGRVAREAFLPVELVDRAYDNAALPIGQGQTISQPFVVALMTAELELVGTEHVLEVGTGSGYQAAVLAELVADVVSVERLAPLHERARRALERLGYANLELRLADGALGWPNKAPYDRIIVTAAAPGVPRALVDQLSPEGWMVIPVGTPKAQDLLLVRRAGENVEQRRLGPVRFVPLIAEAGPQVTS